VLSVIVAANQTRCLQFIKESGIASKILYQTCYMIFSLMVESPFCLVGGGGSRSDVRKSESGGGLDTLPCLL
jgi:hypothetical protein